MCKIWFEILVEIRFGRIEVSDSPFSTHFRLSSYLLLLLYNNGEAICCLVSCHRLGPLWRWINCLTPHVLPKYLGHTIRTHWTLNQSLFHVLILVFFFYFPDQDEGEEQKCGSESQRKGKRGISRVGEIIAFASCHYHSIGQGFDHPPDHQLLEDETSLSWRWVNRFFFKSNYIERRESAVGCRLE